MLSLVSSGGERLLSLSFFLSKHMRDCHSVDEVSDDSRPSLTCVQYRVWRIKQIKCFARFLNFVTQSDFLVCPKAAMSNLW